MMLHTDPRTGDVSFVGHKLVDPRPMPSRREIERALLVLRVQHGSSSGAELDILERAFSIQRKEHK